MLSSAQVQGSPTRDTLDSHRKVKPDSSESNLAMSDFKGEDTEASGVVKKAGNLSMDLRKPSDSASNLAAADVPEPEVSVLKIYKDNLTKDVSQLSLFAFPALTSTLLCRSIGVDVETNLVCMGDATYDPNDDLERLYVLEQLYEAGLVQFKEQFEIDKDLTFRPENAEETLKYGGILYLLLVGACAVKNLVTLSCDMQAKRSRLAERANPHLEMRDFHRAENSHGAHIEANNDQIGPIEAREVVTQQTRLEALKNAFRAVGSGQVFATNCRLYVLLIESALVVSSSILPPLLGWGLGGSEISFVELGVWKGEGRSPNRTDCDIDITQYSYLNEHTKRDTGSLEAGKGALQGAIITAIIWLAILMSSIRNHYISNRNETRYPGSLPEIMRFKCSNDLR